MRRKCTRPTVMVKAGLMLEARTMQRCHRWRGWTGLAGAQKAQHRRTGKQDHGQRDGSLYQPPRKLSEPFASEKTVSVLTSDMVEEKPITARLMV